MKKILLIFIFCILIGQTAHCDFTIEPDSLQSNLESIGQKWPVPCDFDKNASDKPIFYQTFRSHRNFVFRCYFPKNTKKAKMILKTPNGKYEFTPALNRNGSKECYEPDFFLEFVVFPDSFNMKIEEVANVDLTVSIEAKIGKRNVACSFPARISSKKAFDNGLARYYDLKNIPECFRGFPIPVRRSIFYTEYELKIGLMSYCQKR
jgi:hypothetical protein